ncbi:MAG: SufE family protein [Rhodothermales bacterium]|nr:SufE family protein [Rhodothermales bacterium]MBO6781247.1 SufE family protein [Rhodothermales bacterium]
MGRYEHLIELGKGLPALDEAYRTEGHRVRGCQSQVWLAAERTDRGTIHYQADSDALITKGLVALLLRVLDEQPPADVADASMEFLDRIGMKEHLSPTRKNGLDAMIKRMKAYAEAAR